MAVMTVTIATINMIAMEPPDIGSLLPPCPCPPFFSVGATAAAFGAAGGAALRLIFAGTPEFARVALLRLVDAGHEIALVLTQPDRPAGRGMKLQASAVKQAALDLLTDRKHKDDTSKQRHAAYLRSLADWAEIALQFPKALATYWKQIIRCQSALAALDFSSRIVDIEELVEHIEEFGEYDSVHYYALLAQVRQVLSDAKGESISSLDFASLLREPSLPERTYSREAGSSTEALEVARQIAQAPLERPLRTQFDSSIKYNLALARWTLAQQQKAGA